MIKRYLGFLLVILLLVGVVSAGDPWISSKWVSVGGGAYSNTTVFPGYNVTMWNQTGIYTWVVPPNVTSVEFLVIGGGGSGGGSIGGGGGAGGLLTDWGFPVTPGSSIPIGVGSGGLTTTNNVSLNGSESNFSVLHSYGGGGGGDVYPGGSGYPGASGGGGVYGNGVAGSGGIAFNVLPKQGFNGGAGAGATRATQGGGGGSASVGIDGNPNGKAGDGGNGTYLNITGIMTAYAGGGGGSTCSVAAGCSLAYGYFGGGGNGGREASSIRATNGTDVLGGGGGGGYPWAGRGGNGSVIIKYTTDWNPKDIEVDFVGAPQTGTPGTLVHFTDTTFFGNTSDKNITYNWSFGDQGLSTTPLANTVGFADHVYSYTGTYTVNLTINNSQFVYYGNNTISKLNYIIITNAPPITTWYSQKLVTLIPVNSNGVPIPYANISMNFIASSLPQTDISWIQTAFGVSAGVAQEMQNGTLTMSSYGGDDGAVPFMVFPGFLYGIHIQNTTTGLNYYTTLHPSDSDYTIYCPTTYANTGNVTYNQIANTSLYITEPNMSYVTFNLIYQDLSGLTSSVRWNVTNRDNGTVMRSTNFISPGVNTLLANYTVPNIRGQEWIFSYNATRSARS